jgi:ubiquinone/menaquinone biosynthesis C-methylase UbiE
MSAAEYRRMFEIEDAYWWFVGKRAIVKRLLRRFARLSAQSVVLDAGCGTGATLAELSDICRTVGVDYEELPLSFCRRRSIPNVCRADVTQLPFADQSLDAIICTDLLEHLPEDAPAVREFYRTLKPGGTLLVSVPAFRLLWTPHDVALGHYRRYRLGQVRELVAKAGFALQKSSYTVFWLFFVKLLMRLAKPLFFRREVESNTFLEINPSINRLLISWMHFEAHFLTRFCFPLGTSALVVAGRL